MASKLQYVSELAGQTARAVTKDVDGWKRYLTTAARLYKYPFDEQLLIFAQRPDATACAEMGLWNDTMRRWVKAGSKGIALIRQRDGGRPHLEYADFLARMRAEGYEVKEGKHLAFRGPGQDKFTRTPRLGESYTREALRERLDGPRGRVPAAKKPRWAAGRKVNLLIDIQAKLDAGKGAGYAQWAKVFNLKEAAKTLNFLIENGLTDYDELTARAAQIEAQFQAASGAVKRLEGRMAQVAQLKTHIIQYSKTREVYAAYKKAKNKQAFRAEHAGEIAKHEAAKRAFDALGGKPIPKVALLTAEYGALLAEKQEQYEAYKALRREFLEYQTAIQNVNRILGGPDMEQERQAGMERN